MNAAEIQRKALAKKYIEMLSNEQQMRIICTWEKFEHAHS
jgi:hypothetical protein